MKALEYKKLNNQQKSDVEYIVEQEGLWIDATGSDGEEARRYSKLADRLMEDEQKKLDKINQSVSAESEKDKRYREAIEKHEFYWTEWFENNDLYYVTEGTGTYYRYIKQTDPPLYQRTVS